MRRHLAVVFVAVVSLSSCIFTGDAFEDWEPAQGHYRKALPDDVKEAFVDEGHVIAYALSTDCFTTIEPEGPREVAVAEACETEFGVLSEIMTMGDLCAWLEGSSDYNTGKLCGD